jgi:hypothetical protein
MNARMRFGELCEVQDEFEKAVKHFRVTRLILHFVNILEGYWMDVDVKRMKLKHFGDLER